MKKSLYDSSPSSHFQNDVYYGVVHYRKIILCTMKNRTMTFEQYLNWIFSKDSPQRLHNFIITFL